jgi:hypothetical protein
VGKVGDKSRVESPGVGDMPLPRLDWNRWYTIRNLKTIVNRMFAGHIDACFLGTTCLIPGLQS